MNTNHPAGSISGVKNLERLSTTPNGEFFLVNGVAKRGWKDLKGKELAVPSGSASPTRSQFQTNVYGLAFDSNDVYDADLHLEHWIVKDGDNTKYLHIHAGISDGTTASGNNLVITATIGYFKLYNAVRNMVAITPITKTFTATPAQLNAAAGNTLLIGGDTLIAQNGGGAELFDCAATGTTSEIWLPDDNVKVSLVFTSFPTLTGGLHQKVGIFHVDVHEEVLSGGTPKRDNADNSFWYS